MRYDFLGEEFSLNFLQLLLSAQHARSYKEYVSVPESSFSLAEYPSAGILISVVSDYSIII